MKDQRELRALLLSIDHRGYPAYKETKGSWRFKDYVLGIDHVQGDPFASPSNVSVHIGGKRAGFPDACRAQKHRRIALQDHPLRLFARAASAGSSRAGSGKSGLITTTRPGQEILERSACRIDEHTGDVVLRLEIGFPANGRTINAKELIAILFDFLPEAVSSTLLYQNLDQGKVRRVCDLADDQKSIREQMEQMGLCAFVADGAVLPRESGASQRPMKGAVPFESPEAMRVSMQLPHKGTLTGMGIRRGITLIVGGGYHGKSTLLQALERGVYEHIAGDGREFVLTDPSAVKIRAEDGRSVRKADISLFINDLPTKKDTRAFSTEDASGSTSQAANVVEAMEAGTGLLLIDEDTCATNFMVRDELMQAVISREMEPITPFISRIRSVYEQAGISVILVAGSSGSYFGPADTVIQMDRYRPVEITARAKEAWRRFEGGTSAAQDFRTPSFARVMERAAGLGRDGRIRLKTLGRDAFSIEKETVSLRGLEQIADTEQTAALAACLRYALVHLAGKGWTMQHIAQELERILEESGPEGLMDGACPGPGYAWVRRQEILGCLNRYRGLVIR